MNGVRQQRDDDFRARIVLAAVGYNLAPDILKAVQADGPHAVLETLRIPTPVIERAEEALALSDRHGVSVLTPASAFWPWSDCDRVLPAPLVLWAKGQLEVLVEPLINLVEIPDVPVSPGSNWAALEAAVNLSDAGHVLVATTQTHRDRLMLRAARAMGGRWVAVSTGILDDLRRAPLGSPSRGVVVSGSPPANHQPTSPPESAQALVSRLANLEPRRLLGGFRPGEI